MTRRRSKGHDSQLPNLTFRYLTPEWFGKLLAEYQSGKTDIGPIRYEAPHNLREIEPLFNSGGKLHVVARMLKETPRLITHPVVWGLLAALRVAPIRSVCPAEPIREAAESYLTDIIESWVRGMLPGWKLKAPLRKRGRKVSWEEREFR